MRQPFSLEQKIKGFMRQYAYNPDLDQFLVIWEDHHWGWGEDWDIYGWRHTGTGATTGGRVAVSYDGSSHRRFPDVSYNPYVSEYLSVFEYEYSRTDHDVYLTRVAGDGMVISADITVSSSGYQELMPAVGSFLILTAS